MREKTIYEKIAEKYNTTPEEVRREMQEWKKMTLKGDSPHRKKQSITQ
mgnify:CR=1 FL=1